MPKAIYTVITGGYDTLLKAPNFEGWDNILFTDQEPEDAKGWDVQALPESTTPLLQSRDIKINSHIHLPQYDLVCYIDGNQRFVRKPLAQPFWPRHPRRKNIFDEAHQIIMNGRFSRAEIVEMVTYYKAIGYKNCGLFMNGFFIRMHKPDINHLHDIWWEETKRFIPRDQLTLPVAIHRTGIYPEGIVDEYLKAFLAVVTKPHEQTYYEGASHNTRT